MSLILLIGDRDDVHIQAISNELTKMNKIHVILHEFTISDSLTVKYNNGEIQSIVNINNSRIQDNEINSIWNSSVLRVNIQEKILSEAKEFLRNEWREGLTTLWNSICGKWINHPTSLILSSNRIEQLKKASNIGLTTPKTLVTNNPDRLKEFFEECRENIIVKTLGGSNSVPSGFNIFTNKITRNDLIKIDEIKSSPCMFQEYIPKKTEIRATIIGKKINAVEIHSQQSIKTKHDWRRYDDFSKTPYIPVELSSDISSKLLVLMKNMNLEFGAVDLIRTPLDEIVFLEVNPNGRWLWIQELTKMNIAKDIANELSIQS